jgi:hypothetical protein
MEGRDPRVLGDLGQASRVPAPLPSHHHHGLHPLPQGQDFLLPPVRGIAYGVEDLHPGVLLLHLSGKGLESFLVLSGLSHETDLIHGGQRFQFLQVVDHVSLRLGIPKQADDFGVILFPGDDNRVAVLGVAVDDPLDLSHMGTGGIQDLDPGLLDLPPLLRADPMGPDDQSPPLSPRADAFFHVFLGQGFDPFPPQDLENLGVVDQGAVGIDGAGLLPGRVQGHVHRPSDTHAETGIFG